MNQNHKAFAEIIESSLESFTAQSWQWNKFPAFGSLVTVTSNQRTIYGIVHQIKTGSMDPLRYPFPYQKTEEELLREQPQIFEFLKTTFTCLPLGYQQGSNLPIYLLPPEPPKIHAFVSPITRETSQQFFANDHYLHVLFSYANQIHNIDELLLAVVKNLLDLGIFSKQKLTTFIETFSLLTGNDYRRLKLFMHRAQPLISTGHEKETSHV